MNDAHKGITFSFFGAPLASVLPWVCGFFQLRDQRGDPRKRKPTSRSKIETLSEADWKNPILQRRDMGVARNLFDSIRGAYQDPVRLCAFDGANDWTVVEGALDPKDPNSLLLPVGLISKVSGATFYRFLYQEFEGEMFRSMFSVINPDGRFRKVDLFRENGWSFSQKGEPLSWENEAGYESRNQKSRLTLEILQSYMEKIEPKLMASITNRDYRSCVEIGGSKGRALSEFSAEAMKIAESGGLGYKWV